jgi:hypothetical protein
MGQYRKLADLGATVLILHHNGKADSARDYRGSSDFKASLDAGYLVTNIGNPARIESLRLKAFKQRFAVNPEFTLRFREGEFQTDDSSPSQTNEGLLQSLLIENPRVTMGEFEKLAVAKGVPHNRVRSFLKSGIQARTIDVEAGQNNSKFHTWIGMPGSSRF